MIKMILAKFYRKLQDVLYSVINFIFFLGNFALPAWVIELSSFVPILLLFEFALVYLDPHLESLTGGEPAYKLLINAGIAAGIFPIHQFFES